MRRLLLAGIFGAVFAPIGSWTPRSTAQPVKASIPVGRSEQEVVPPARDFWEALLIGGEKVGFRTTKTATAQHAGATVLEISAIEQLAFQRGGETMTVRIHTQSQELTDGTVVTCSWEERIGALAQRPQSIRQVHGAVSGGQIIWEKRSWPAGSTSPHRFSTDWMPGGGGYFALEQSLRRKPMQPGEDRTVTELAPLLDTFITTELDAKEFELTNLLTSRRRLLRIESVASLPGDTDLRSTLWTDERGEILKSEQPAIQLVVYRTSRQDAERMASNQADLFAALLVPMVPAIADAHMRSRLTYEIALAAADPSTAFASDDRQQWTVLSDRRARVTVRARRPDDWLALQNVSPRVDIAIPAHGLRSTSLIDFDDPDVQELAAHAAIENGDSWSLALELERLVYETIAEKNFESAMAPASVVAKNRQGDCTEHAVLLAALCRAHRIPARVAAGLVYVESAGGFLYHMWNEVWIDGVWRPLDATSRRGGVGATHLKITDSLLEDQNVYAEILPVLNVVGQAKVRLIDEP